MRGNKEVSGMHPEDITELGLRLQNWHVGGDAIYQVGSYLFAGLQPSFDVLFEALRLMTENYNLVSQEHSLNGTTDRLDAYQVLNMLINYIEYRVA